MPCYTENLSAADRYFQTYNAVFDNEGYQKIRAAFFAIGEALDRLRDNEDTKTIAADVEEYVLRMAKHLADHVDCRRDGK